MVFCLEKDLTFPCDTQPQRGGSLMAVVKCWEGHLKSKGMLQYQPFMFVVHYLVN